MSKTEQQRTEEQSNRQKYTPEQSNVLYQRRILLSNGVKPQEKTLAERNDVKVEYDLVNDLGFNLCVVPWSPVMRWSCILE